MVCISFIFEEKNKYFKNYVKAHVLSSMSKVMSSNYYCLFQKFNHFENN